MASGSDDLGFWLEIFVAFVVVAAFEAAVAVAIEAVVDVIAAVAELVVDVAVVTDAVVVDAAFVFADDDHFALVHDCEPGLGQESVELDDVVVHASVEIPVDEMYVADVEDDLVVDEEEAWQVWPGHD